MSDSKNPVRVEVSYKTILFAAGLILGIWFLFLIREIILLTFLSVILVAALLRPVEWLHSRKVPRGIAVLIVYLAVIFLISGALSIIIPPLVTQTGEFVASLPKIIGTVNDFLVVSKIPVEDLSSVIASQIDSFAGNIVAVSSAIFGSIFLILTLFVLSFYILMEWRIFVRVIASPFSGRQEKRIINLFSKVEKGLGAWVRGQLTLSVIIGTVTYIGLLLLGIPFALPLALVAGILEVIPLIGPIISAIPAVLVAFTISPVLGLAVIALYFIVQQLENHIVVPMVMSKVVGLQPAAVIIALLIGAKLGGIGGAFLAVPVILVIRIFIKEFLWEEEKLEEDLKSE